MYVFEPCFDPKRFIIYCLCIIIDVVSLSPLFSPSLHLSYIYPLMVSVDNISYSTVCVCLRNVFEHEISQVQKTETIGSVAFDRKKAKQDLIDCIFGWCCYFFKTSPFLSSFVPSLMLIFIWYLISMSGEERESAISRITERLVAYDMKIEIGSIRISFLSLSRH